MKNFPSFLAKIRRALSPNRHNNRPPLSKALCFSPVRGEFEQVFRYFDKDGDGKISASELCRSMESSFGEQLLQAEVIELVESSDSDGDGKLGYEDFLRLVQVKEEEDKGRILREAFSAYEMEGKGFITARSLRRALRRIGEERTVEDCKDMIKRNDDHKRIIFPSKQIVVTDKRPVATIGPTIPQYKVSRRRRVSQRPLAVIRPTIPQY